jgi:hypothetical protein
MSGSKNGVAAKLLIKEKHAIYTHCYGHALNLAVGNTMKQSKVCCEALELGFEVSKLIKINTPPKEILPLLTSRQKILKMSPLVTQE